MNLCNGLCLLLSLWGGWDPGSTQEERACMYVSTWACGGCVCQGSTFLHISAHQTLFFFFFLMPCMQCILPVWPGVFVLSVEPQASVFKLRLFWVNSLRFAFAGQTLPPPLPPRGIPAAMGRLVLLQDMFGSKRLVLVMQKWPRAVYALSWGGGVVVFFIFIFYAGSVRV